MILAIFAMGALAYSATAWISYYEPVKLSPYYFPIGLALSLAANFGWLMIAKIVPNRDEILIYGAFWDIMIMMAFLAVPLLWFEVRLETKESIGLAFIIVGILTLKVKI